MGRRTQILIRILLLIAVGCVFTPPNRSQTPAQTGSPIALERGNAHRDGVFASPAVARTSDQDWESEKLFVMLRSTGGGMSGGARWDYSRGDPPFTGLGTPSVSSTTSTGFYYLPPVVKDGVIYFALYLGDGYLFAVDAKSGKTKWKSKRSNERFITPSIHGDTLYVGASGMFFAVDANTQKQRWKFDTGDSFRSRLSPLVTGDTVYFGSAGGGFFALDRITGAKKWDFGANGRTYWDSPIYDNGRVIGAELKGTIHAWDAETGKELWKKTALKGVRTTMLADGTLFFVDGEGYVNALDSATGLPRPEFSNGHRSRTMLAASDGKVFFGGWDADGVFAVDAGTGQKAWTFDPTGRCNEPAIAGGVLYLTCRDKKVYAVDAKTGKKIWSQKADHEFMSAPVVADGAVYFVADDGKVHAIR